MGGVRIRNLGLVLMCVGERSWGYINSVAPIPWKAVQLLKCQCIYQYEKSFVIYCRVKRRSYKTVCSITHFVSKNISTPKNYQEGIFWNSYNCYFWVLRLWIIFFSFVHLAVFSSNLPPPQLNMYMFKCKHNKCTDICGTLTANLVPESQWIMVPLKSGHSKLRFEWISIQARIPFIF